MKLVDIKTEEKGCKNAQSNIAQEAINDRTEDLKSSDNNKTKSESKQVDMLHGSLLDKIVLFAVPLALSSMLQQLFNTADTAVVGRFASAQDMAAVGANNSVISLIISLFMGLSVGANVSIARLIGLNRKNRINDAIGTIILLAGGSGILLLVIGFILSDPIHSLISTPKDVTALAVKYLRIYSIGMPFIMLYNFGAAILRSKGDSKTPLYSLIIAGVINVLLNLIFVILFKQGVAGVGYATVISNVISAGIIIYTMIRGEEDFRLRLSCLKLQKDVLTIVLKIGVPAGLQGVIFAVANTVIQSSINGFGSAAVAGSTASQNMENMSFFCISAFNQAATTFISQNYSAQEMKRCKVIYRYCLLGGLISCGLINVVMFLLHDQIIGIFTTDPEVQKFAFIRMQHVMLFQWMAASYEVSGSSMRGMGISMLPMVLTIFGCVGFRVFWVMFIFPVIGTFSSLMMVYFVSWIITGTTVIAAYYITARKYLRTDL